MPVHDPLPLRVDWLDAARTHPGRLGMTILPGRRDRGRDLARDVQAARAAGVSRVLCLVTTDEMGRYGVPDLLGAWGRAGAHVHHLPIPDFSVCAVAEMRAAVDWVDDNLRRGEGVLAHCVGGLGRSGMAVACWLVSRGAGVEEAIREVRRARGPGAVETAAQEEMVRRFGERRWTEGR